MHTPTGTIFRRRFLIEQLPDRNVPRYTRTYYSFTPEQEHCPLAAFEEYCLDQFGPSDIDHRSRYPIPSPYRIVRSPFDVYVCYDLEDPDTINAIFVPDGLSPEDAQRVEGLKASWCM